MEKLKTLRTQRLGEHNKGSWRSAPMFRLTTYCPCVSKDNVVVWRPKSTDGPYWYHDARKLPVFKLYPIISLAWKPVPRALAVEHCGETHIFSLELSGLKFEV